MRQKGFAPVIILVGLLIIFAVAGGVYYLGRSSSSKPVTNSVVTYQVSPTLQATVSASPSETANWKIFTSENYGYSFKYPTNFWISSVTTGKKVTAETFVTTISDAPPPANTVAMMSITDVGQKPGEDLNSLVGGYMGNRTGYLIKQSKNVMINNYSAIYLETVASNKLFDIIFIETDPSNVVIIDIYKMKNSLQPVINQILSTFKFTQ